MFGLLFRFTDIKKNKINEEIISYQGSLDVLFLASLAILPFASPSLQCRSLQGPTKGEGEGPGPMQGTLVDGIQIDGSFLLTLST